MSTIVVNIKGCKNECGKIDISKVDDIGDREIVYVGRVCKRGANNWQLDQSVFKNPYSSNKYGLSECVRKYIDHVYTLIETPEIYEEFFSMKDKVLACWCKPKLCHADVLCYILDNSEDGLIDKSDVVKYFDDITSEIERQDEEDELLQERINESRKQPITLDSIIPERIIPGRSKNSYRVSDLKQICSLLDIEYPRRYKKIDFVTTIRESLNIN